MRLIVSSALSTLAAGQEHGLDLSESQLSATNQFQRELLQKLRETPRVAFAGYEVAFLVMLTPAHGSETDYRFEGGHWEEVRAGELVLGSNYLGLWLVDDAGTLVLNLGTLFHEELHSYRDLTSSELWNLVTPKFTKLLRRHVEDTGAQMTELSKQYQAARRHQAFLVGLPGQLSAALAA